MELEQADPSPGLELDRARAIAVVEPVGSPRFDVRAGHGLAEQDGKDGSPIAVFADRTPEEDAVRGDRDILAHRHDGGWFLADEGADGWNVQSRGSPPDAEIPTVAGPECERIAGGELGDGPGQMFAETIGADLEEADFRGGDGGRGAPRVGEVGVGTGCEP